MSNVRRRRMPFTQSKAGMVATNGGNAKSTLGPASKPCRVGTSQSRPRTVETRKPRSRVQFGTKLKFGARSHGLCLPFCGTGERTTSSRLNACLGSPTSRTLAAMKRQFQSTQARRRRVSSQSQKQSAMHQNPAPNPSIERTRTGRPRMAFISFWAMHVLPARAAHVTR